MFEFWSPEFERSRAPKNDLRGNSRIWKKNRNGWCQHSIFYFAVLCWLPDACFCFARWEKLAAQIDPAWKVFYLRISHIFFKPTRKVLRFSIIKFFCRLLILQNLCSRCIYICVYNCFPLLYTFIHVFSLRGYLN